MRRTFHELVTGFAQVAGCECRAEEGSCQAVLEVGGLEFQLGLIETSGMLVIYTGVGLLPASDREPLLLDLLKANNLFADTTGLTLGVDLDTELVTLQLAWEMEHLDETRFANLMANVGAEAARWLERLDRWRPEARDNAAPTMPQGITLLRV